MCITTCVERDEMKSAAREGQWSSGSFSDWRPVRSTAEGFCVLRGFCVERQLIPHLPFCPSKFLSALALIHYRPWPIPQASGASTSADRSASASNKGLKSAGCHSSGSHEAGARKWNEARALKSTYLCFLLFLLSPTYFRCYFMSVLTSL